MFATYLPLILLQLLLHCISLLHKWAAGLWDPARCLLQRWLLPFFCSRILRYWIFFTAQRVRPESQGLVSFSRLSSPVTILMLQPDLLLDGSRPTSLHHLVSSTNATLDPRYFVSHIPHRLHSLVEVCPIAFVFGWSF
ncbi:hypothetical protein P692DRAFT_20837999 [Suillus brevipes Sb2]|nr:hypothetical protein P692DRAFT_20837999 [Suillus brevipes Sb2]